MMIGQDKVWPVAAQAVDGMDLIGWDRLEDGTGKKCTRLMTAAGELIRQWRRFGITAAGAPSV